MTHGHNSALELRRDLPDDEACPQQTQGFETFSREQYGGLLQYLRRRVPNEEDAKDAAQESLIRLLRYRETKPTSSWKPLLYRIAINVVGEQFRRAGARRANQHIPLEGVEIPSEDPTQEDLVEQQQREALLRDAVLSLPPRLRQVYLLSRMDGLSYTQIARHCDVSVKTVEKRMAQALAILAGAGSGSP